MGDDLPTEYDVIVIGTGLVESIVAAASARIGKKVLHLDKNSYYGNSWGTFNLENFEQWFKNICNSESTTFSKDKAQDEKASFPIKNCSSISHAIWEWFIPVNNDDSECVSEQGQMLAQNGIKKISQKFNIDLSPRILFSKGPMVELLIRSGVSRYTEFVNVHNILLYVDSVFEQVPYSKSDIFSTRSVSVVEKRILMKLLQEIQKVNNESLENYDFKDKTFHEFLKKFQIPENIEKYILYSIARVSKNSPCIDGIKSAQSFLNSLGVYGNSPYLWPLYGSSELVQAYCRLCAVYGGIYCLNRGADQVLVDGNRCCGILSEKQSLMAEHVVMSSDDAPSAFFLDCQVTETVSRGILITDKPLFPSGKKGTTLLHYPSRDTNSPPLTIIELDGSTLACSDGFCIVHLIKLGGDNNYEEFEKLIQELFEPCELWSFSQKDESKQNLLKPRIILKVYFNLSENVTEQSECKPPNFHCCRGPVEFNFDFFSEISEAEKIFKQMFPDDEFLPRPEEFNVEE